MYVIGYIIGALLPLKGILRYLYIGCSSLHCTIRVIVIKRIHLHVSIEGPPPFISICIYLCSLIVALITLLSLNCELESQGEADERVNTKDGFF